MTIYKCWNETAGEDIEDAEHMKAWCANDAAKFYHERLFNREGLIGPVTIIVDYEGRQTRHDSTAETVTVFKTSLVE